MMRSGNEPPGRDDSRGDGSLDTDAELDVELRQAVEALRRMPAVQPGTTARVAAAARGERSFATPLGRGRRRRWPTTVAWATAAGLLVAAAGVTLAGRGRERVPGGAATVAPPAFAAADSAQDVVVTRDLVATGRDTDVTLATVSLGPDGSLDDAPVLVPFVLKFAGASHVALVGDFNGWNPSATPLAATGNGVWTTSLSLTPGRHAYGFVVDDTLWVRDPRADTERDADYGRDHSVVVVGRP